jgi:integrase
MSLRAKLTDTQVHTSQPKLREYALHDSVLRGFALRVRPSGAKTWVFRSRQGRVALGDACTIPVAIARQRAHAILSGLQPESARRPAVLLRSFAKLYLQRREKDWRPSTKRTQQSYLSSCILPALGDRAIDRIGGPDVSEWFHVYSRTRPGGANRAIAVLSDMFTRATDWGILPEDHPNPCALIRRNRTRAPGRMLNEASLARLGSSLEKYALIQADAVDAIRLLIFTGARPGEIFHLQWAEVEVDRIVLTQAKRGPRSIPLGTPAQRILAARKKVHRSSRFVFPHRSLADRPLMLPTSGLWRLIKRDAGLQTDLRLQDLRHNFASHVLIAGESLLVAGALLGHSRPAMTARYAHLADDNLLQATQKISSMIRGMTGAASRVRTRPCGSAATASTAES